MQNLETKFLVVQSLKFGGNQNFQCFGRYFHIMSTLEHKIYQFWGYGHILTEFSKGGTPPSVEHN